MDIERRAVQQRRDPRHQVGDDEHDCGDRQPGESRNAIKPDRCKRHQGECAEGNEAGRVAKNRHGQLHEEIADERQKTSRSDHDAERE